MAWSQKWPLRFNQIRSGRILIGLVMIAVIGIRALSVAAQTPGSARVAFDVAAIKPYRPAPGESQGIRISPGGRFSATGVSLKLLIALAYHLDAFQLEGADKWIATEEWTVEAESEGVGSIPKWAPPNLPEKIAERLRSLLEDRFALKMHRETRLLPVYSLTISQHGSKLVAVDPPGESAPGQSPSSDTARPAISQTKTGDHAPPPGQALAGPGGIIASAATMKQIIVLLGRLVDKPIIDNTHLSGNYNVKLQFDPESTPRVAYGAPGNAGPGQGNTTESSSAPGLFAAIEEQMGLKLVSTKAPVEIMVVDSAQPPTAN
jgi:uncharacterized protein (TIGR03435 family)